MFLDRLVLESYSHSYFVWTKVGCFEYQSVLLNVSFSIDHRR